MVGGCSGDKIYNYILSIVAHYKFHTIFHFVFIYNIHESKFPFRYHVYRYKYMSTLIYGDPFNQTALAKQIIMTKNTEGRATI